MVGRGFQSLMSAKAVASGYHSNFVVETFDHASWGIVVMLHLGLNQDDAADNLAHTL